MPLDVTKGRLLDIAKPAGADVADADAAVGDVKDPKTFYSVAPPKKTGTMLTVAIVAANDNYPAGYHAGDAGGLDAIDFDLAEANIKSGVTIFGKLGTFAQTITHDVQGSDVSTDSAHVTLDHYFEGGASIAHGADGVVLTKTIACTQATVIEAAYFISAATVYSSATIKIQLYIDGVAQGESGFLTVNVFYTFSDIGYASVASGDRIVYLNAHNYHASQNDNVNHAGGLFAAACKNV